MTVSSTRNGKAAGNVCVSLPSDLGRGDLVRDGFVTAVIRARC